MTSLQATLQRAQYLRTLYRDVAPFIGCACGRAINDNPTPARRLSSCARRAGADQIPPVATDPLQDTRHCLTQRDAFPGAFDLTFHEGSNTQQGQP